MKALALVLVLALFLVGSFVLYNRYAPDSQPDINTGEPDSQPEDTRIQAPDFTVTDGAGEEASLSDFLGTPVVINVWASWCGPCKSEMGHFDAVAAEYEGKVQFMMINAADGARETQETGQAYVDEMGYTFPVYFDLKWSFSDTYGIRAYPTTFFVDEEGYVVAAVESAITEKTLRQGVGLIYSE